MVFYGVLIDCAATINFHSLVLRSGMLAAATQVFDSIVKFMCLLFTAACPDYPQFSSNLIALKGLLMMFWKQVLLSSFSMEFMCFLKAV